MTELSLIYISCLFCVIRDFLEKGVKMEEEAIKFCSTVLLMYQFLG
jgi:hypothetical protein